MFTPRITPQKTGWFYWVAKSGQLKKADAWIIGAFYKHRLTRVFGEL